MHYSHRPPPPPHHHLVHIPAIRRGYNHSTMGNGIGQIYTISFTNL